MVGRPSGRRAARSGESGLRFLLDTQVLWWWCYEEARLSAATKAALGARENDVRYSPLSLFELALKRSRGHFRFDDAAFETEIVAVGLIELPVTHKHALVAGGLPFLHRDPFDRLLIGQALSESLVLVTSDRVIQRYAVTVMRP